ncbi:PREDICTED: putative F-box/FBD/LRR-repeat protein At5g62970-like [Fragaria vesca subsp. vesca]
MFRRNVVEFEFVLEHFPIPQDLFMCKTLRSLKLYWYENDLSVEPPELGCFPNLKVFHAIVGASQVPSFVKLLSRCPVLEFLTIEGITQCGDDQVNDIEVTGAQMKTLKIRFESDQLNGDTSGGFKININAPKLENLYIRTDGSVSFSFTGSVKSLVNVSIAFGEFEAEKPPIFCGLLDVVSSVKYLTLSASRFKDWHLPAFGNLNQLELVLWDCNYMELLALFLHSAPNLEDIILVCSTKFEVEDSVFQWNPPEEVPVCLSSHLKTISP